MQHARCIVIEARGGLPMKKTPVGYLALLGPVDIIKDAFARGVNVERWRVRGHFEIDDFFEPRNFSFFYPKAESGSISGLGHERPIPALPQSTVNSPDFDQSHPPDHKMSSSGLGQ
jgi:hypothetical protein